MVKVNPMAAAEWSTRGPFGAIQETDAPAMPEVVGDAALLVPPTNVNAWAEALARVLTDSELQRDLSERGPLRATQFSWESTAQKTLTVYEAAVRGN